MESRRIRKRTTNKAKRSTIESFFLNQLIRIVFITLISAVIYMMFFPPIIVNLLDLIGVEGDLLIFPAISTSVDYYGLVAFVLYFLIHVILIRIFVQDNQVFIITILSSMITLGLYILIGQLIFGLIAFIYGISEYEEELEFRFQIRFLNLLGLILLYAIIYLILARVFLKKNKKRKRMV